MKLIYDDGSTRAELKQCPYLEHDRHYSHCGAFAYFEQIDGLKCAWPKINPPERCPVRNGLLSEYHFLDEEAE